MADEFFDLGSDELDDVMAFNDWRARERAAYRHERLLEQMQERLQRFEDTGTDCFGGMLPWSSPVLTIPDPLEDVVIGWAPRYSSWYSRVHWLHRFQEAYQGFDPEEIQPIFQHFHIGGVQ